MLLVVFVLQMLLVIGGVERNPGPSQKNEKSRYAIHKKGSLQLEKLFVSLDGKFYCQLCPSEKFSCTRDDRILKHIRTNHIQKGIQCNDYVSVPCFKKCSALKVSQRCHFHCPICPQIICRASKYKQHLATFHCNGTPTSINNTSVKCPKCGRLISAKTFNHHLQTHRKNEVLAKACRRGLCVDGRDGLYLVARNLKGPFHPVHCQKKLSGSFHHVQCELEECIEAVALASRSLNPSYECPHVQAVFMSERLKELPHLKETVLDHLCSVLKIFSSTKKADCLSLQSKAETVGVPLLVPWPTDEGSQRYMWFSVFTDKQDYWCIFRRTVVTFDSVDGIWFCKCRLKTCVHRAIAKWYVFQEIPNKLLLDSGEKTNHTCSETHISSGMVPMNSTVTMAPHALDKYIKYLKMEKRIPLVPVDCLQKSAQRIEHLIPVETTCEFCCNTLDKPSLITSNAKIVTLQTVHENICTYFKECPTCFLHYRYQEFKDGLVNYNNYLLLDINTCMWLRSSIKNHVAIGRVRKTIEDISGCTINKHDFFNAYLFFEALSDRSYEFTCNLCGYYPPILISDVNKKSVFNQHHSSPKIPKEYSPTIDVEKFWSDIECEVISRGFVKNNKQNPFRVVLDYDYCAPWLGRMTRAEDFCFNTEYKKVMQLPAESEGLHDLELTEDRLCDVLQQSNMKQLRKFGAQCKLSKTLLSRLSKKDLVQLLQKKLKGSNVYDKLFSKIKGASGGWLTASCPHKVIYAAKCLLRAESPRDHVDVILSLKHQPTIVVNDIPHMVAAHGNIRKPNMFQPFNGMVAENTISNITAAEKGELQISMPWVTNCKADATAVEICNDGSNPLTKNCHPITKQTNTFCLYDRFHQKNTKRKQEVLRRIELIPELKGYLNTEAKEQLNSLERKDQYFLDVMGSTNQMLLYRCIIDSRNVAINAKLKKSVAETKWQMDLAHHQTSYMQVFDSSGRLKIVSEDFKSSNCKTNMTAKPKTANPPRLTVVNQCSICDQLVVTSSLSDHVLLEHPSFREQTVRENCNTGGLENYGATCWFNACVQAVARLEIMASVVPSVEELAYIMTIQIIQKLRNEEPIHIELFETVCCVRVFCKFEQNSQEDAHEFLQLVIAPLINIFENISIQTKTVTHCQSCWNYSTNIEDSLPIIYGVVIPECSVQDICDALYQPEHVQWNCLACEHKLSPSLKQSNVMAAGNILFIVLNRFAYDCGITKIHSTVHPTKKLTLVVNGETHYFDLKTVIVHLGESAHVGHYLTYEVNSEGNWKVYNDKEVHWVVAETALADITSGGYIFVYTKEILHNVDESAPPEVNISKPKPNMPPLQTFLDDIMAFDPTQKSSQCVVPPYTLHSDFIVSKGVFQHTEVNNLRQLYSINCKHSLKRKELAAIEREVITMFTECECIHIDHDYFDMKYAQTFLLRLPPNTCKPLRTLMNTKEKYVITKNYIQHVLLREACVNIIQRRWDLSYEESTLCYVMNQACDTISSDNYQ